MFQQNKFVLGSKLGQGFRLGTKSSRDVPTKVFLFLQGRELVTGGAPNPDEEVNYFRLHVNQHQSVETITCYTRQVSLNLSSVQLLLNQN